MPGSGLELLYLPPERDARAELASLPELPGRARAMFPDLPEWLYALALEQQAAQLAQMKQHALHQSPSDWLAQAHAYLAPEEGILHLGAWHAVPVTDPEQSLALLFIRHVLHARTVAPGRYDSVPSLTPAQLVRHNQAA